MELKWYVFDGWKPRVRPASAQRDWMDAAPNAFPYRCLPLNIANGHGWDILTACGFEDRGRPDPAKKLAAYQKAIVILNGLAEDADGEAFLKALAGAD